MGYIFIISSHLVISIFSLFILRALCFVEVFYISCLRRIIHSCCWHTATEFSGGAPPAMWESLGYCTIVVVFECVGLTRYVIFGRRHWLLLGACMFTLELYIASCRDGVAINFPRKIELDPLDNSHLQIGKTVDTFSKHCLPSRLRVIRLTFSNTTSLVTLLHVRWGFPT
jgi:hypothetical protein